MSRRSGRTLPVLVLAASAAVIALGLAPPAAAASCDQTGSACVVVQVVGADGQAPLRYIHDVTDGGDVSDASYSVPDSAGVSVSQGTSVRQLVSQVANLDQVTFVEIGGGANDEYDHHILTAEQLGASGHNGFVGGLLPVFYQDSTTGHFMDYVRPLREGDPTDDQRTPGPDQGLFLSAQDDGLELTVHLTGAPLDVHVTATPTDDTDRSFTLSTSLTGGDYSYAWHFPTGPGSTDAAPTYGFPADSLAGTYPVTVGVQRASDGSFGWGTVDIQVGSPPAQSASPSPTPSTPPGSGGGGQSSSGPTKAPSASATGHPNPEPNPGHGGSETATATATTTATTTGSPTDVPSDAASATAPVSATSAPTSAPAPTAMPAPDRGPSVTGILLTSSGSQSQSQISDAPPPSAAARPIARPALRVDPLVWGGAGAVLLLLAGAASESVGVRRRLGRWLKMGP